MIRLFSTFFDSTNQGGSCIIVSLKPSLNKNPLMTTTQLALDKKAHPLMMHLSILPKYDISQESSIS